MPNRLTTLTTSQKELKVICAAMEKLKKKKNGFPFTFYVKIPFATE